jgi:U3 small nucleolar RNA-associated protein 10
MRFDKIVLPLLSQLTTRFESAIVIPAVVALTSKVLSEENDKLINDTLIKYTKSDSGKVRLAAIKAQQQLYLEISGRWLQMLPPTIPIISEVMEDDDENVVEAAHELIATIEKEGGISMTKLFT